MEGGGQPWAARASSEALCPETLGLHLLTSEMGTMVSVFCKPVGLDEIWDVTS